jgi:hypothetical protein
MEDFFQNFDPRAKNGRFCAHLNVQLPLPEVKFSSMLEKIKIVFFEEIS